MRIKRLRVFAGSNGFGKSELYKYLVEQKIFHPYLYVNADEIAQKLETGYSLQNLEFDFSKENILLYLENSTFAKYLNFNLLKDTFFIKDNILFLTKNVNQLTYLAAGIADFLRNQLLLSDSSFSCETVFSHPSKLEFLKQAKEHGFKIYLYYIATKNPAINIERVDNRVEEGGHFVPKDKIESRYYKTMENLYSAILLSDKAYLFDNSNDEEKRTYSNFAKVQNGCIELLKDVVPDWFERFVINKQVNI
ncbi:MAG: zeta toxin family protein [Spirochaetia bacterium]|nr:zeta toxin family protein [Spirochaetia bacterium]